MGWRGRGAPPPPPNHHCCQPSSPTTSLFTLYFPSNQQLIRFSSLPLWRKPARSPLCSAPPHLAHVLSGRRPRPQNTSRPERALTRPHRPEVPAYRCSASRTEQFVFFQARSLGHDLPSSRGHNQRLRRRLPGRSPRQVRTAAPPRHSFPAATATTSLSHGPTTRHFHF